MLIGIDAHTVGRRATGNERVTVEMAAALVRRGDVDVIAYLDHAAEWPADAQPAPRLVRLRARRPQLRIPLELPVRTRRDRVDLLQVTYVAPPVIGVPLVTVVHDLSFEDHPELYPARTRLRLRATVGSAVRRSAAVVTGSDFTRRRLLDVYGLPPARVHQVRYGVGANWRPMEPDDAQALTADMGLPPLFVLAVGTSAPRKNLARLVAAVESLRAKKPELAELGLVLAGPVDAMPAGAPWVTRLGYVSDETLRALYSVAGAVAYVSLYEGFGLPVLEALACGAVVVASATTATAEAAGEACVTVDPREVTSIAGGLSAALLDEPLRAGLRSRAPAHVAGFSWDACAGQMMDVYRAALAR